MSSSGSSGSGLPTTGGAMTGAIAMGGNKITGLADGSAAGDAGAFGQIPLSGSSVTSSVGADSTASTAYHALATPASCAAMTRTLALVIVTANCYNDTTSQGGFVSFSVSGATTLAAGDTVGQAVSVVEQVGLGSPNTYTTAMVVVLVAGGNTFELEARLNGTGSFVTVAASITVIPLN